MRRHLGDARTLVATLSATALVACSTSSPGAEPLGERVDAVVQAQLEVDPMMEKIRAVVVTHDGETVLETYQDSTAEDHHVTFSVTKSITSTLVGIAIDDGLIDGVDATLGDLLPLYRDRMTRTVAATSLEQLLRMTGGFTAPEDADDLSFMESRDPVAETLAHPYEPPGREFVYSNGASHLLAAILVEATGMPVLDYARQELFDPLGIPTEPALEPVATAEEAAVSDYLTADSFGWPVDRQGLHLGWGWIKLRATDMIRIGQLYLNDGVWDGEQVVPADWVAAATTAQVPTGIAPEGYGYQWWVGETDGHPTFAAQGHGGQVIQVVPDLDLVIVVASEVDTTDPSDFGVTYEAVANTVDLIVEQVGS